MYDWSQFQKGSGINANCLIVLLPRHDSYDCHVSRCNTLQKERKSRLSLAIDNVGHHWTLLDDWLCHKVSIASSHRQQYNPLLFWFCGSISQNWMALMVPLVPVKRGILISHWKYFKIPLKENPIKGFWQLIILFDTNTPLDYTM